MYAQTNTNPLEGDMESRSVLIVEDDVDIAKLIALHLRDMGHTVTVEHNGRTAFERVSNTNYDLLVLDLTLPGLDGLEICRKVRSTSSYAAILMLTARTSELDRILGLEVGADDYLTKPFSVRELVARVRALFRRMEGFSPDQADNAGETLTFGDIEISPESRDATKCGTSMGLTAKEFDLLEFFARHPGRVYTRAQLLDQVWGYAHEGYEHTVNTHINRLRRKVEDDPSKPRYILTVWGVGYKFPSEDDFAGRSEGTAQ